MNHIDFNIDGIIAHHALKYRVAMPDSHIDKTLCELTRTVPIIPLFYHIPVKRGITRTVATNYSTEDRGSIFLLERLEILKSQEARFKLSDDPDIADMVLSYAKLTAFGVEVFRECISFSGSGQKRKRPRKKRTAS
jgi:hypothetical protein